MDDDLGCRYATLTTDASPSAHAEARRWLDALFESPVWFPREVSFTHDRVLFASMTEAAYRDTAFLGGLADAGNRNIGLRLSQLVERYRRLQPSPRALHYIFHVGHCGSTLLSRMLGSLRGVLSLREPPPLFALAQRARALRGLESGPAGWPDTFGLILSLLSRTFRPGDVAVVKPISHANNLMAGMLDWTPDCRGVLLYVDLETYLATMLRPATRRETARAVSGSRLADFHARAGNHEPALAELDDARKAALVWLVQMREFADTLRDPSLCGKVRPLEFDCFLSDSRNRLGELAAFFDRHPCAAELDDAVGPELAHRYSKSVAYAFDARARDRMLEASRRAHSGEIAAALDWAAAVGRRYPAFASLCETVRTAAG